VYLISVKSDIVYAVTGKRHQNDILFAETIPPDNKPCVNREVEPKPIVF